MDPTPGTLFEFLYHLAKNPEEARLDPDGLPGDFRRVGLGMMGLAKLLCEAREYTTALSRGDLRAPAPARNHLVAPLKNLQASLLHLTWQAQQVAEGDYGQRVDFMGEFAAAFNAMTGQLEAQRQALLDQIEESRRRARELEQGAEVFRAITERSPQMIFVLDRENAKCRMVNQAARQFLGASPALRRPVWTWLRGCASQGAEGESGTCLEECFGQGEARVCFSATLFPLAWRNRAALAFLLSDQTETRRRFEALENVAHRDPMTQVANRYFGMLTLREWIARQARFLICFIDLDGLKYVNDTFGHQHGDDYIVGVSRTLSAAFGDGLVCRLGGDEFMVLLPGGPAALGEERLARARATLGRQATGPYQPYTRSISYGVLEVPPDNTLPESELLAEVDARMYVFKRAHRKERAVGRPPPGGPDSEGLRATGT